MIAIIVISFLVLTGAVFTIYLWRALSGTASSHDLPPPQARGLFEDRDRAAALMEAKDTDAARRRLKLIERARMGDLNALTEARSSSSAELYGEVLDLVVAWASARQERLNAVVSFISKSTELRANKQLAEQLIQSWKAAPSRRSTTEMVHIAALSDEPAMYQRVVQEALEFWRRGELNEFSAEELTDLFVSQFWLIAPEARRGGEGFALKRKLSGVRRELAAAAPAR